MGPAFRNWLAKGTLGVPLLAPGEFLQKENNAILNAGDAELMNFAKQHLDYNREKGLDFVARFNKKYIIGEAKFLTDDGGHQNAQFVDAISTLESSTDKAIKISSGLYFSIISFAEIKFLSLRSNIIILYLFPCFNY